MKKIKKYRPSKGFICTLFLVVFTTWLIFQCVPLTEKRQEEAIKIKMDHQRLKAADEFDKYTDKEREKLPKFDSRKYFLIKRNARFWLIPREYQGDSGFYIRWPDTVNNLLEKDWENETSEKNPIIRVFMESRQFNFKTDYTGNVHFLNKGSCINKNNRFIWNGMNIRIYPLDVPNLTDEQYLDVCLTILKILNEKIKEIHYVN